MMGQLNRDQEQLFYYFNLEEVVPGDHLVRAIAAVLDLSWVRAKLQPLHTTSHHAAVDIVDRTGRPTGLVGSETCLFPVSPPVLSAVGACGRLPP
jgi:hypothetical protein